MKWWRPGPDQPELLDWWRPLLALSRRARDDEYPWAVHLEDFALFGRVRRRPRPDVWVYGCPGTGGELYVDEEGETYRFRPTPNARGLGQFRPCELRSALWRCGVPYLTQPDLWDPPEPEPEPERPGLHVVR